MVQEISKFESTTSLVKIYDTSISQSLFSINEVKDMPIVYSSYEETFKKELVSHIFQSEEKNFMMILTIDKQKNQMNMVFMQLSLEGQQGKNDSKVI